MSADWSDFDGVVGRKISMLTVRPHMDRPVRELLVTLDDGSSIRVLATAPTGITQPVLLLSVINKPTVEPTCTRHLSPIVEQSDPMVCVAAFGVIGDRSPDACHWLYP